MATNQSPAVRLTPDALAALLAPVRLSPPPPWDGKAASPAVKH
jgi:hypothetical protein